jgi:hypothetical protein
MHDFQMLQMQERDSGAERDEEIQVMEPELRSCYGEGRNVDYGEGCNMLSK